MDICIALSAFLTLDLKDLTTGWEN